MRTLLILTGLIAVLFLPASSNVEAQRRANKTPPKGSAKPVPVLTAEAYRDLIVNTADGMSGFAGFGEITPGTRVEYVNGRARDCILTFTVTEAKAKFVADRIKAWARVRVPKALAASHEEILKWMKSGEAKAKLVPRCFEPMLNASSAQWDFMVTAGEYDDLRVKAATALQLMGVTLQPIEKSTPEMK